MERLEFPQCRLGYPREQLARVLGDRLPAFNKWMVGQTSSICDGRFYDHDTKQYHNSNCGPHGVVVYPWDVQRFVDGRPVID